MLNHDFEVLMNFIMHAIDFPSVCLSFCLFRWTETGTVFDRLSFFWDKLIAESRCILNLQLLLDEIFLLRSSRIRVDLLLYEGNMTGGLRKIWTGRPLTGQTSNYRGSKLKCLNEKEWLLQLSYL